MLASRREEAAALGVPPDLIEDVLRRVMRESYSSENDKGFKTLHPNLRPVVIVGGGGQMGRLFEKMLTLSGYQVRILEKKTGRGQQRLSPMPGWLSSAFRSIPQQRRFRVCRCRRIAFWSIWLPSKPSRCRRCWRRITARYWDCTRCLVRIAAAGETGGGLLRRASAGSVPVVP